MDNHLYPGLPTPPEAATAAGQGAANAPGAPVHGAAPGPAAPNPLTQAGQAAPAQGQPAPFYPPVELSAVSIPAPQADALGGFGQPLAAAQPAPAPAGPPPGGVDWGRLQQPEAHATDWGRQPSPEAQATAQAPAQAAMAQATAPPPPPPQNPAWPPMPTAPGGGPKGSRAEAAPRPRRRGRRPLELILIALALALMLLVGSVLAAVLSLGGTLNSLLQPVAWDVDPPKNTFSVVTVVGAIQNVSGDSLGIYEPSYQHGYTLQYINQLAQDSGNTGILLYMDTPGGTVMECDEVYLALMDYKARTGRPVWCYMASQCASAGYYIAAAADHIVANRQTLTGSIGVYITLSDTSGLYEKLGIESILIASGANKGVGTEGVAVTPAQQAVYQSIVDEYYDTFVSIVAEGRGLSLDEAYELSDGRPYTGKQALALGLVDELGGWEYALAAFEDETYSTAYYPNFSTQTGLGRLLSGVDEILPKGEADTLLDFAESLPSGVPYSYYGAG